MPNRMRRIDPRSEDTQPLTSGAMAPSSTEELAYLVTDFAGLDILIKLGTSLNGDRVMKQWMRETGTTGTWHPTVEMLLEFDNYFKDTNSGLTTGTKGGDTPPPQGG